MPLIGLLPVAAHRRRGRAYYPAALCVVDGLAMAIAVSSAGYGAAVLVFVVLNATSGLYRFRRAISLLDDLPLLVVHTTVVTVLAVPAGSALATGAAGCALVLGGRAVCQAAFRRFRPRRPALVVGAGPLADRVLTVLRERPEYGLDPTGLVTAGPRAHGRSVPVLGGPADLRRLVKLHRVDTVIVVLDEVPRTDAADAVRLCADTGRDVLLVASALELAGVPRTRVEHLAGIPCVSPPVHRLSWTAKRVLDRILATAALLVLWPVMLACAVAVRVEGGPGVIFRQHRVGERGRPFVLLKFRTLQPADEAESATRWSIAGDERVGPVGRFLRSTSLDELPQLWNVVRGEMSLVGPRPERLHFVRRFSRMFPGYPHRHRVPPGITGWAQVHGLRGDTSIAERARFDNHYIDTWTLWTDMKILLLTLRVLFSRSTA